MAGLALGEDPRLAASIEKRASIEGHGFLHRHFIAARNGFVKAVEIDPGAGEVQREPSRRGREESHPFRPERAAQIREGDAQAVKGARLGAVGPEEPRQRGAFDRGWMPEDEVSEESLSFSDAKGTKGSAVQPHLEGPQQLNRERCGDGWRHIVSRFNRM